MVKILSPVKIAVNKIMEDNSNLLISDKVIEFTTKKLKEASNDAISEKFLELFSSHIESRKHPQLVSLMKFFDDNEFLSREHSSTDFSSQKKKECLEFAAVLYSRLFEIDDEKELFSDESICDSSCSNIEDDLANFLEKKPKLPKKKSFAQLIEIYESTGVKGKELTDFENALLSVQPTSVMSERVFSIAGNYVRIRRNRMSPELLNALIILNCFKQ